MLLALQIFVVGKQTLLNAGNIVLSWLVVRLDIFLVLFSVHKGIICWSVLLGFFQVDIFSRGVVFGVLSVMPRRLFTGNLVRVAGFDILGSLGHVLLEEFGRA